MPEIAADDLERGKEVDYAIQSAEILERLADECDDVGLMKLADTIRMNIGDIKKCLWRFKQ